MSKFYLTLVLLMLVSSIHAQTITGVITDTKTSTPIEGVEISINSDTETIGKILSDDQGRFRKELPQGSYTFYFYKDEYTFFEKDVNVGNDDMTLDIGLNPFDISLDEVVVFATPTRPTKRIDDALHTGTEITTKGLEVSGVSTNNSIFTLLNVVPSVSTLSTDAYGLGDNFIRIRGMRNFYIGMTVEGVPNYGLSPIGARESIYEKENLQSVSLYKGAVPADVFSGSGNRGGSIDLSIRRSPKKIGGEFHQALGTDSYSRSFLRFNTGEFVNGDSRTSAFFSLSYTTADKWKGLGKLANRKNFSAGVTHRFNDKLSLELFSVYNTNFRHDFKRYKYKDILEFDKNYEADFTDLSDKSLAEYRNYYDYNKTDKTNITNMLLMNYAPNKSNTFNFKVYHAKEDGVRKFTVGSTKAPKLRDLVNDFWQAGMVLGYTGKKENFTYSAGYWFEASDNQGYNFLSFIKDSGLEKNQKRDIFVEPTGLDYFHTPYVKAAYTMGDFKAQVGLKYMAFNSRGSVRYFPASHPNGGGHGPEKAAQPTDDLGSKPRLNDAWLPSVGIGYKLSDNIEMYANYGKGYMRQYSGVTGAYLKNRQKFLDAGYTFQTLLDQFKTETSDNFDLGLMYNSEDIRVSANVFLGKQNNVLVNVINPVFDVVYRQNVGSATVKGFELESYFKIMDGLTFYANPTFTQYEYDKDLKLYIRKELTTVKIKGKQSPATPRFMLKTGLMYNLGDFSANAFVSHTGERFGDATNLERVDAFTLLDASLGYKIGVMNNMALVLGVEAKNITGAKYVGMITSSDEQRKGGTAYYYGPPRAIVGSVKLKF